MSNTAINYAVVNHGQLNKQKINAVILLGAECSENNLKGAINNGTCSIYHWEYRRNNKYYRMLRKWLHY
jgi:hypothetical protein